MGALDAGTGGHGKFCVFGAGRGRGKEADKSQPASTETSFLSGRCVALALPFDPRLRCWHRPSSGGQGHPHSQVPGRAHDPPVPPPSTHCLASALNSGAQKHEGSVRREIHFLKMSFESLRIYLHASRGRHRCSSSPWAHGQGKDGAPSPRRERG